MRHGEAGTKSSDWDKGRARRGRGALASGLTGALVASPAGAAPVTVFCTAGQLNALQATINSASQGSTINVLGTCTGNFHINANQDITLQGPATLDGNNTGAVLLVNPGANTTLDSLIIQHGKAPFDGGVIDNELGTVTLNSSLLANNNDGFEGGARPTQPAP